MPVSTTATITLVDPVVKFQAFVTPMSAPAVPPFWPRLFKAHNVPLVNAESVGVNRVWTM